MDKDSKSGVSKAAKVIDNAIGIIERYGWIRRKSGNEIDGFCLMGALNKAASGLVTDSYRVFRQFPILTGVVGRSLCISNENVDLECDSEVRSEVIEFNDRRCASKTEAIEFLTEVKKKLVEGV